MVEDYDSDDCPYYDEEEIEKPKDVIITIILKIKEI
jgi:hypothetical protein